MFFWQKVINKGYSYQHFSHYLNIKLGTLSEINHLCTRNII